MKEGETDGREGEVAGERIESETGKTGWRLRLKDGRWDVKFCGLTSLEGKIWRLLCISAKERLNLS